MMAGSPPFAAATKDNASIPQPNGLIQKMPLLYNDITDKINQPYLQLTHRICHGNVAFPWQVRGQEHTPNHAASSTPSSTPSSTHSHAASSTPSSTHPVAHTQPRSSSTASVHTATYGCVLMTAAASSFCICVARLITVHVFQIPIKMHHFIRALLEPNPELRLGMQRRETRDVYEHTCFEGFDWQGLKDQRLKVLIVLSHCVVCHHSPLQFVAQSNRSVHQILSLCMIPFP